MTFKKLLSSIAAGALLLGLMTFTAFADDTWQEVADAAALSNALQNGGNYRLTAPITVDTKQDWSIGSGVSVVLDLNNNTIKSTYRELDYFLFTINGGSFTVTDLTTADSVK